jgi:multisubunit Na+/H+ antiporter MnhG subunit
MRGSWRNRELILDPFDTGCLLGGMLGVFRNLARRHGACESNDAGYGGHMISLSFVLLFSCNAVFTLAVMAVSFRAVAAPVIGMFDGMARVVAAFSVDSPAGALIHWPARCLPARRQVSRRATPTRLQR